MRLERFLEIYPVMSTLRWFPNVIYGFVFSLAVYLAAYRNLDVQTEYLEQMGSFNVVDEFDFIIVGAGSAGALAANRLSKNYSVLLLEAGGEPHPLHMIPAFSGFLLNYPEVDWLHKSVPQRNSSLALKGRESLLSQGKSLGGTSNINFLIHSRGNPKDFDAIAEMVGDSQWNYENLLPFFKKHEDYVLKPDHRNPNYSQPELHGTGGELRIEVPPYIGMARKYLEATKELGYNRTDLNGYYTEGFDYTYNPSKLGRRQSTFTAFLEPVRGRFNLTIRKFAHVTKILLGKGNHAYGVAYDHHGHRRYAHAKREVRIRKLTRMTVGALNTPKILMLSGIGPKDDLEELGIPVFQDLPVGKSFQDHASTYLGPFFINQPLTFDIDRDAVRFPEYLAKGTGPLSHASCSAFGFLATDIAKSEGQSDWPDVQIIFSGSNICKECDRIVSHAFNLDEKIMQKYYRHAKGRDMFIQLVSNARPRARGEIKLRSSDPRVPALIDPKYLDNEHDVRVTVEGMKKAIAIAENTTTFQKMDAHFTTEPFPGCEGIAFRSDAYFECYLRHYTVSLHHIVASAPMAKGPETGVVDTELRVFGTKGLRVIDCSIIPLVPVGNTNAAAIMIGEKGADLVLKSWETSNTVT